MSDEDAEQPESSEEETNPSEQESNPTYSLAETIEQWRAAIRSVQELQDQVANSPAVQMSREISRAFTDQARMIQSFVDRITEIRSFFPDLRHTETWRSITYTHKSFQDYFAPLRETQDIIDGLVNSPSVLFYRDLVDTYRLFRQSPYVEGLERLRSQIDSIQVSPALTSLIAGLEQAEASAAYREVFEGSFANDLLERLSESDKHLPLRHKQHNYLA